MFIRCAWHLKNFGFSLILGEKEPYSDTEFTDGICPACIAIDFPKLAKANLAEEPGVIETD